MYRKPMYRRDNCGNAMRVGVISDIHADPWALRRALEHLQDRGVDKIVCLGDVVEKGPDGDAVVAILRDWLIPVVGGNHDENAVRHSQLPLSLRRGDRGHLRPHTLRWLDALPTTREYVWAGRRVLLAHGIPTSRTTYVFEDDVPKRLKRVLRRTSVDVVLLGHTHRPMRLRVGDVWVLNPGSVCTGRSRDSHTCAVLSLPTMDFEVIDVATGATVEL